MVPENISSDIISEDSRYITKTYLLDFNNKRINGYIDGKAAIEQAIRKTLDTKRYAFEIYDWNYGSQISELIGSNMVKAQMLIEGYIEDALLADNRIEKIENFAIEKDFNKMSIKFDVITNLGIIQIEMEADI